MLDGVGIRGGPSLRTTGAPVLSLSPKLAAEPLQSAANRVEAASKFLKLTVEAVAKLLALQPCSDTVGNAVHARAAIR